MKQSWITEGLIYKLLIFLIQVFMYVLDNMPDGQTDILHAALPTNLDS